jgi:hypothetical protein
MALVRLRGITRARARPELAVARGATALGAVAMGALAVGSVAIGALAIRSLFVRNARIHRLVIDELQVHSVTGALRSSRPSNPRTEGGEPASQFGEDPGTLDADDAAGR